MLFKIYPPILTDSLTLLVVVLGSAAHAGIMAPLRASPSFVPLLLHFLTSSSSFRCAALVSAEVLTARRRSSWPLTVGVALLLPLAHFPRGDSVRQRRPVEEE